MQHNHIVSVTTTNELSELQQYSSMCVVCMSCTHLMMSLLSSAHLVHSDTQVTLKRNSYESDSQELTHKTKA